MKYRKIPVVIDAILWDGNLTSLNALGTFERPVSQELGSKDLLIETLEGVMRAKVGDYIIKGVQGELYPCKPDIFALTYADIASEKFDPLRTGEFIFANPGQSFVIGIEKGKDRYWVEYHAQRMVEAQ